MATLEQIQALELIQQKRRDAKTKHIKVVRYLSVGHKKYQTTLSTMISIGALSVVSAFLYFCLTTYRLAVMICMGELISGVSWFQIIYGYVVFLVTAELGTKIYRLDATPTFMLVSLITMLIINILCVTGIIPCLTVILTIVGLVCWGTYKNWFDTIAKSIAKKRKTENKIKAETKSLDQEKHFMNSGDDIALDKNHTANNIPWIITVVILSLLVVGGSVGFYFLGRSHGYNNGAWEGYNVGYDDGAADGYKNGFSGGESAGYNNGYNVGYDNGYNDMWNKAMCIVSGGGSRC